ncbi:hypothetical protein BC940DRAFT_298746 [Gongronella butleri]|nr:hypothetical protein BC940DRAFT_298746 [Gongronella butleri]
MGIFTEEVQKTSVTLYIERLSNYEEIEWYQFQQLMESMNMQESGPREAIEAIRKRLKHGSQEQKMRVLEILKLLMENSPQQFRRQLASNEKMRERFEIILSSPEEEMQVKKQLLSLLGAWCQKYKGEPGSRALASVYESGLARLGKKSRSRSSSAAAAQPVSSSEPSSSSALVSVSPSSSPSQQQRRSMPPPVKPPRPVDESPKKKKTKPRSQSSASATFNFQTAKPKIIQEIALANQHANQLANALKLINTTEDGWDARLQHDQRLQEIRAECEESKKRIVKYARLVEDEEWIGTLLSTNEELLKALDMYDIMSVGEIPATMLGSPTDDANTDSLSKDLSGLQLVHRPAGNDSDALYDGNDDDPENPFADPFADPVDVPATSSSHTPPNQRK